MQDEMGQKIEPVEGPYTELFTAQQQARAAHTQKVERAQAKAEEYRREHRDSKHNLLLCHHLMTPGGCIPIG